MSVGLAPSSGPVAKKSIRGSRFSTLRPVTTGPDVGMATHPATVSPEASSASARNAARGNRAVIAARRRTGRRPAGPPRRGSGCADDRAAWRGRPVAPGPGGCPSAVCLPDAAASAGSGPPAGSPPGLQPAAVQVGVLERDRQPEPGAAGGAGPGRVGAPEPVEDQRCLAGRSPTPWSRTPTATAVSSLPTRRRPGDPRRARSRWPPGCAGCARPGAGRPRRCRPPVGLDAPARMPVLRRRAVRGRRPPRRDGHRGRSARLERGGAGVEPADLEQVGQQRLEAVELVVQQLGGAGRGGVEVGARVVQHSAAIRIVVSGVRSSCETSETKRCCTRDRSSSCRICRSQAGGHLVEARASRARSSSPRTRIRSSRRPGGELARRSAAACDRATTTRVTSQATTPTSRTSARPPDDTTRRTTSRVASSWSSVKAK